MEQQKPGHSKDWPSLEDKQRGDNKASEQAVPHCHPGCGPGGYRGPGFLTGACHLCYLPEHVIGECEKLGLERPSHEKTFKSPYNDYLLLLLFFFLSRKVTSSERETSRAVYQF